MSTVTGDDILADPAGVMVTLIAEADPGLERGVIREAVTSVTGARQAAPGRPVAGREARGLV